MGASADSGVAYNLQRPRSMQPRHLAEIAPGATLRAVAVTLTLLFGGCPGEGVQLQPDGGQPDRGPDLGAVRDAPLTPGDGPAQDGAPPSDGSRSPADGAAAPDGPSPPDAKPKPDTSPPPKCTAGACSGHGVCSVSGGTPSCACDEGFTGPTCAQKRTDFWRRTLIRAGLGDPNVHRVHDDLYYLTGTEGNTRTITVYRSTDLETFKPLVTYDPSKADPKYDYCWLWAPDLAQVGQLLPALLLGPPDRQRRLVPRARRRGDGVLRHLALNKLSFSAPKRINPADRLPSDLPLVGLSGPGLQPGHPHRPRLYQSGTTQRLYFNWFSGGNNIPHSI